MSSVSARYCRRRSFFRQWGVQAWIIFFLVVGMAMYAFSVDGFPFFSFFPFGRKRETSRDTGFHSLYPPMAASSSASTPFFSPSFLDVDHLHSMVHCVPVETADPLSSSPSPISSPEGDDGPTSSETNHKKDAWAETPAGPIVYPSPIFFLPSFLRSYGSSFLDEEFYNAPFTAYQMEQLQQHGKVSWTCYFPFDIPSERGKRRKNGEGNRRSTRGTSQQRPHTTRSRGSAAGVYDEEEVHISEEHTTDFSSSSSSNPSTSLTTTTSTSTHLTLLVGPPTPSLQSPFSHSIRSYFQNFSYTYGLLHACLPSSSSSSPSSSSFWSAAPVRHLLRVVLFRRHAHPSTTSSTASSRRGRREGGERSRSGFSPESSSSSSSSSSFSFDRVATMVLAGVRTEEDACTRAGVASTPSIVEREESWYGIPTREQIIANTLRTPVSHDGPGRTPRAEEQRGSPIYTWYYEPQPSSSTSPSSSSFLFLRRWSSWIWHRYHLDVMWDGMRRRYAWFSSSAPRFKAMVREAKTPHTWRLKELLLSKGAWKRLWQERKLVVEFVVKEWELPSSSLRKEEGGRGKRGRYQRTSTRPSSVGASSSTTPPTLSEILREGKQQSLHIISFPPIARKRRRRLAEGKPSSPKDASPPRDGRTSSSSVVLHQEKTKESAPRYGAGMATSHDSSRVGFFSRGAAVWQRVLHRGGGWGVCAALRRAGFRHPTSGKPADGVGVTKEEEEEEEEFVCDYHAIQDAKHHYLYDPIVYVNPHSSPSSSVNSDEDRNIKKEAHTYPSYDDEDDDDEEEDTTVQEVEDQEDAFFEELLEMHPEQRSGTSAPASNANTRFSPHRYHDRGSPSSRRSRNEEGEEEDTTGAPTSVPLFFSLLPLRALRSWFFSSLQMEEEESSGSFLRFLFPFSSFPSSSVFGFFSRLLSPSPEKVHLEQDGMHHTQGGGGGGFSFSASQLAAKSYAEHVTGELGPTAYTISGAASATSSRPSRWGPSTDRNGLTRSSLFTQVTHQVYSESVVVVEGVEPSGTSSQREYHGQEKEEEEETDGRGDNRSPRSRHPSRPQHRFHEEDERHTTFSPSNARPPGSTSSSAPPLTMPTLFLTRYQFRWEAVLPATRTVCVSLAPTAHMKRQQVQRLEEQQRSLRSLSRTHAPETPSAPSMDKEEEKNASPMWSFTSEDTEGHTLETAPWVAVELHEEVYLKTSVWVLLFCCWLVGYTRSTLLHRGGLVLEWVVIGICGGVCLGGMLAYYLLRKMVQQGMRKRTLLFVLAIGGMSAIMDLLVALGEQLVWVLDTHSAFLHWRAYLFTSIAIAWVGCSFAFRVFLPSGALTTITTHSLDGLRVGLLIAAWWQHAEATCMTVLVYLVSRALISVWLFLLWLRYDPLLAEEQEAKRKRWRAARLEWQREKRQAKQRRRDAWKRSSGEGLQAEEEDVNGAPWWGARKGEEGRARSWRGAEEADEDTFSTTSSSPSYSGRSSLLRYALHRSSHQLDRWRRTSGLSYLLNTARLSSGSSSSSRGDDASERLSTTFHRRFAYREQTTKHYTLSRVLFRWCRRVLATLMAILQHSLDDLDSEDSASGSDGEWEKANDGDGSPRDTPLGKEEERSTRNRSTKEWKKTTGDALRGAPEEEDAEKDDPLQVRKGSRPHSPADGSPSSVSASPAAPRGHRSRGGRVSTACLAVLQAMATPLERRKHPRRYRYVEWHAKHAAQKMEKGIGHTSHPEKRRNRELEEEEEEEEARTWLSPAEAVRYKTKEVLAWRRRVETSRSSHTSSRPPSEASRSSLNGADERRRTTSQELPLFSRSRVSPVLEADLQAESESFLSSSSSSDSEEGEELPEMMPQGRDKGGSFFFGSFSRRRQGVPSTSDGAPTSALPKAVFVTPTSSSFYRYGFKRKPRPSSEAYFKNSINDPLDVFPPYVYEMDHEEDTYERRHRPLRNSRHATSISPPRFSDIPFPRRKEYPTRSSLRRRSPHAYHRETEAYTKQSLEQLAKHIRSQQDLAPLISRLRRPNEVLEWAKRAAPSSSDEDEDELER